MINLAQTVAMRLGYMTRMEVDGAVIVITKAK